MNDSGSPRLERSCGGVATDWMRIAPSSDGIERIEARFGGHGFDPHRHDTYGIGFTQRGVQAFRYRGEGRRCLAGQVFVLHPDEVHDGRAGSEEGFRYRILYVAPELIRAALGADCPLPFVREVVSDDRRIRAAIRPALDDLAAALEPLQRDQVVLELADALAAADPSARRRALSARHWRAVERARELLDANVVTGVGSADLEAATGFSRYAVARHFRACLGTSPYRYLVLRRLERARGLIGRGVPLAEAALVSGFADQSHLTRQFRKAYGLPPGRWTRLSG